MVDINQWRASIGGWSCRCTSVSWSVSNNKVKTNPTITDSVSILAGPATLSLALVLVLLLVLSGDIELNPGPGSKPELSDVFRFLQPHSSKWDDIGRALDVDLNTRRRIEQGGQVTSTERKLEEVIDHWIQSCCSEVTWDHLIKVLRELQMVNTAKEIESGLLNDEKMKAKYNWVKANDVPKTDLLNSGSTSTMEVVAGTSNISSSSFTSAVDQHLPCTADPTPSQTPECVQHFRCQYKAFYKNTKTPVYHKKPSPSITDFINLILIRQKRKNNEETKNDKIATLHHKIIGDTAEITKESTFSINDIGQNSTDECSKAIFVLIEGDPGVGKTTLAWELCKGWTEGRLLQTWDIVLLVQLRAKNIREAKTLQSLIDPYNTHRRLCEYIQDNHGAGLMLIFDGFDELSDTQRQGASFFMGLLRREILSEASIILTTRPSAIKGIPEAFIDNLDQHIAIHGFEEEAIHRYIECKFKDNSNILEAFQDYVSSHHFIFSLMYVPLHCALITDLYEHYYDSKQEFAPKTLTELYTCLICCLIWRTTGKETKSLSELSDDLKHKFTELARIAAMGIENKQYVFDDFDASLDQFGLLQRVEIANEYYGCTSESYSFLHLTLQEYLAAYWSTSQKDFSKLFDSKCILPVTKDHMHLTAEDTDVSFHWPVVLFYSGLTGIKGTPLESVIIEAYQWKNIASIYTHVSVSSNFLNLLFECGNPNVISRAFAAAATGSRMQSSISSSIEAYITGYCIARANTLATDWGLKMEESGQFMKNLVHGIEHGKLKIIAKRSQITKIEIGGYQTTDVVQIFNYLEKISDFLENLNVLIKSEWKCNKKTRNSNSCYTFKLTKFSSIAFGEHDSTETLDLLNILETEFNKSLRAVSIIPVKQNHSYLLQWGGITETCTSAITEDGEIHLNIDLNRFQGNSSDNSASNYQKCQTFYFPGPLLSDVCSHLPSYSPNCCYIPYVVIQHFIDQPDSFGYLQHGYNLLPYHMKRILHYMYKIWQDTSIGHWSDTDNDDDDDDDYYLYYGADYNDDDYNDDCNDDDHYSCIQIIPTYSIVILSDFHHRFLLRSRDFFSVHFYNCNAKKWFVLKSMKTKDNNWIILATPELEHHVELLMHIIKNTETHRRSRIFRLFGKKEYLQPFVTKNDLESLEILMNRPRLAVILDRSLHIKLNAATVAEMIEIDGSGVLISLRVFCDQLQIVAQQCSVSELEVTSFSMLGNTTLRSYTLNRFRIFLERILVTQSASLKEFKLKNCSLTANEAQVIHDGLVNNHGLEVMVFDTVAVESRSTIMELLHGLMNHSTLKTLIINGCSLLPVQKLIHVICSERNLKHLILKECNLNDFSVNDYQTFLLGVASNKSIEEVAICEDKKLIEETLTNFLPLLHGIKLVVACPWPDSELELVYKFTLTDSQVIIKSYEEFEEYVNSNDN